MKVLELFCGYGTASFALKMLGIDYECVGYSDIDKYANQCFKQNHSGKELGDATKIEPHELEGFDLLTGGFPCQAFSQAGKGLGETDTRGTLFREIIRIAEVKKPNYMLLENVKGLTNKKHRPTFEKILSELERIGYHVHWKVLNTKDYGIPQNRERVFFVCFRNFFAYRNFEFPEKEKLNIFLKDILEDEVDEKYYLKEHTVKRLLNNGQGFKSKINPEVGSCLFASQHKVARGMDMIQQVGMINQTCKKRVHDTPKKINQFLKDNKQDYSVQEIADYIKLPKTQVEHYFRTDSSRAIPSPNHWIKLRELLKFSDDYDKQVTDIYEKEVEFESTRRVYSDEGCSPTISSTNADKIIQLNNPTHSNDRIYDEEGISPTLNTMQGGNRQPFIIDNRYQGAVRKYENISPTLTSHGNSNGGIPIPFIAASRGRNPSNTSDRVEGCPTEQRLEAKEDGTSNTISTVQKDNYVCSNLTIRKLTPKECFRLQGFLNDEVNLEGLSNTQQYKLAGNGQSVNVVEKIFRNMFRLSQFDTEASTKSSTSKGDKE